MSKSKFKIKVLLLLASIIFMGFSLNASYGYFSNESTSKISTLEVEYDKPNVTLTYKNCKGQKNKVFAVCNDIDNFDKEKVLEKALLKAFQNEIINISAVKNNGQV